jgi:hypothetical protein
MNKSKNKSKAKGLLGLAIGVSCLLFSVTQAIGICWDRSGPQYPNYGFCTIDPNYQGGRQVCLPGGFTCDGQG